MTETMQLERVLAGFTLVFRLKASSREPASRASSAALDLIKEQRAERVFGGREGLAVGDPLARLYVAPAGDERETRELLERLEEDHRVEMACVAPIRDVLAER